jgi:hypothetical protein
MKVKYLIFAALFIVLLGIGIGLKMFFKPHANIVKQKPDFTIEATILLSEFNDNENVATTKYSEKVIEISGKLVAKSKLENGTDLLILEDEMQGISCQLDSSWAAANQAVIEKLQDGGPVKVKGVCKGYLMEIKISPAMIVK